ncbi:hypothetical protein HKX48_005025 [Thoreauomyces humboldtii]|nr:hypothetical protein HKX48_005025 [Thoreauomyces humboldtii]
MPGNVATPTPMPLRPLNRSESVPDASTPAMTTSVYAARIRMLEQALRQSEARYEDLRGRHDAAVSRFQQEQQEVINGKLETERRCENLEDSWRDMEQVNAELELRCSMLEGRVRREELSTINTTPNRGGNSVSRSSSFSGRLVYHVAEEALTPHRLGTPVRGDGLDSDSVRSIWGS